MADRLPFEYVDGCTGPVVNTNIVPPGLPICVDPVFEDPDVYVAKVDTPDVQPPPCVTPGSDEDAEYHGMWKVRPAGGTSTDEIDVLNDLTEDDNRIAAKAICSGVKLNAQQDDELNIPVPEDFLEQDPSVIGYVVLRYKRTGTIPAEILEMAPFTEDIPPNPRNIKIMTEAEYDAATAALPDDYTLVILARVWTDTPTGEVLQIEQAVYGAIETSVGGNCGTPIDGNAVVCRITGGSGPLYGVEIYADGPGMPATGTGSLFVMQMLVLHQLAAGTWVVGCAANLTVLGETP